jgi:hypothetical protein
MTAFFGTTGLIIKEEFLGAKKLEINIIPKINPSNIPLIIIARFFLTSYFTTK